MENIFNRIFTGIISLFIGGILNGLAGLLLAYFTATTPSPDNLGAFDYRGYFVFPLMGAVLGSVIGLTVGISQLKFPFSVFLGAGLTFVMFVIFVMFMGGNDVNTTDGRKGIALVLLVLLIDGCFISFIVGQCCQWWLKFFAE